MSEYESEIEEEEIVEDDAAIQARRIRAIDFERQRRKEKLIERIVALGAVGFVTALVVLVYNTDNQVSRLTSSVIASSFAPRNTLDDNPAIACRNPKNKNTAWCQEYKGRQDSTWRAIERQGEKANVFSLHGR